jgi:branched-chain amino acid transport system ATP-binding protein
VSDRPAAEPGPGATEQTMTDQPAAEPAPRPDDRQRAKANGRPVLELVGVSTHYGLVSVLRDVNVQIYPGEIVSLLGGNASGKTTTLKTVLGMVVPSQGEVRLDGEVVSGRPTIEVVSRGITMVPENRRLFSKMTVFENLELGAYQRRDKDGMRRDLDRILAIFPRLKERLTQKAGTLSGGEQQMVAMGRALMAQPKVLLMDEPSMGLAPILVEQVFNIIKEINDLGTTVFVVEQNANMALSIADYGYVLQTGQIVLDDSAQNLLNNPLMREAYLGEL